MKKCNEKMGFSVLALAVQSALAAMCVVPMVAHADAADDEIAEIRRPSNFIEAGVLGVSNDSAKFGEYNGLNKAGPEFIGNFSLKGGSSYEGGDGTMRWGVRGADLGTTSREFGATIEDQGSWSIGFGYDELRHNTAAGYQTPYNGSMGGNGFTLPAAFTGTNVPTAGQVAGSPIGTQILNANQLQSFRTVDIGSTRKNTSLTAGYRIDRQWDIKFEYNHLEQSGAKLMAFSADKFSGIGGASAESISILPNPTNYDTDTMNLALNWVGEKAYFTIGYFGSYFRDGYDRVTWETYQGALAVNTMTTAPSNDFHQFNLTGGFEVADKTKLNGGVSYSRNTQDVSFIDSKQMNGGLGHLPATSLNGEVNTTHADVKLTNQSVKDLTLSAGVKYDERVNSTPSNIYDFFSFNSNEAKYPNTPLSTRKTQSELAADYRLNKSQNLRLALNHDETKRWCENYAVSTLYPAGTNCVVAKETREDKLTLGYRLKANENLNFNAGYAYAQRRTDFDILARTAMISTNGLIVTGLSGSPLAAVGTLVPGQNGGDFIGFHPYLDENRDQHMLKAGANWQATDQLSFSVTGRYTDDTYDTTYGWKDGQAWSLNLDATYLYSDNGSVSTYVTQQSRKRSRTDLRAISASNAGTTASAASVNVPNYATDSGTLKDDDFTVGLAFKQAGLLGNKLVLNADFSYSVGKTAYGTTLDWPGVTSAASGSFTCSDPRLLTCGDLPDIKNTLTRVKLSGEYALDKHSKINVAYLYAHLSSNDYYYNGLQYGYTPTTLMPTNQTTGSYNVNMLGVSYIYAFK